jgi:hypothetical protein
MMVARRGCRLAGSMPPALAHMKIVLIVLTALALTSCGAAKAARDTGLMFDKYGCLARDFKGETPCKTDEMPSYN